MYSKTIFNFKDGRRIGEGCFHEVGGKLYYYATYFDGSSDNSKAKIVRYLVDKSTTSYDYIDILSGDEAKMNVMDVSICDNKLFYLRKNGFNDCQIRYYGLDDKGFIVGDSSAVTAGGYNPMINDCVRKLSNGEIIIPSAYHVWGERFNHAKSRTLKNNGYAHWDNSNFLDKRFIMSGLQEPVVEEICHGYLIMFMRSSNGWLYISRSYDYGVQWSKPKRYCRNPLSPVGLKKIYGGFLLVGNQRLVDLHGVKMGPLRTPLVMTVFNNDFQFLYNVTLADSLSGFYCYPSIYEFGHKVYIATYTTEFSGLTCWELEL